MQLTQLSTRQRNRKAIEEVTCSSSSTLEQHFFNTHSTHFRSCWSTSIPGVVPLNISALGHCFLLQRKVFPGMGHNCEYVSSLVSRKAIMMMYFQFPAYTLLENHPKCRIWIFEFWHFPPIFALLKLTCLVTLFDHKLQVFKNSPKWTIFGIYN